MRSSQIRISSAGIIHNRQVRWLDLSWSTYLDIPGRKCWPPRTSIKRWSFEACFFQWIGLGGISYDDYGTSNLLNLSTSFYSLWEIGWTQKPPRNSEGLRTSKKVIVFAGSFNCFLMIVLFTDLWKCMVCIYIYKSHTHNMKNWSFVCIILNILWCRET